MENRGVKLLLTLFVLMQMHRILAQEETTTCGNATFAYMSEQVCEAILECGNHFGEHAWSEQFMLLRADLLDNANTAPYHCVVAVVNECLVCDPGNACLLAYKQCLQDGIVSMSEEELEAATSQSSASGTRDCCFVKRCIRVGTLTVTGNATIDGSLTIGGNATINNNLTVLGTIFGPGGALFAAGTTGTTGDTGGASTGTIGTTGTTGTTGSTGSTGSTGATGSTGSDGSVSLSSYGYFFNNDPAATVSVPPGTFVPFTGSVSANINLIGAFSNAIQVLNTGTYAIIYTVTIATSSASPTQFDIVVVGPVLSAVYSGLIAGTQIVGVAILTLNAGDTIRLENTGANTATINTGGTVGASVQIIQIT